MMSLNTNLNLMTEESRLRRKRKDHERYIANREERLEKQRTYYASNRKQCIAAVRNSEVKRIIKESYARKEFISSKIHARADDVLTER